MFLIIRWVPPILWMAAIFLVSGQSHPEVVPASLQNHVGHGVAYAVLAVLWLRALLASGQMAWRSAAARAFVVAVAYGATDELHQWFVPDRTAAVDDWVADVAGAALGLALAFAWRRMRARAV
jgi:VanZ family protein